MDNIKKLRELTEALDFSKMVTGGDYPKIPTKDPDVFGEVVGVIKSKKEARVAIVDFPAGAEMGTHYHEEKEIFVILSGKMILTNNGKTINLTKGDTYYVSEQSSHSAVWPVKTRLIAITIPDAEIIF